MFEARRLHDWQVGRLLSLENAPGIRSKLPPDLEAICAVTHEATRCDKFAPFVKRWNSVTRRERHETFTDHLEIQAGRIEDPYNFALCHHRERFIDLLFISSLDHEQRLPDSLRCGLHLRDLKRC